MQRHHLHFQLISMVTAIAVTLLMLSLLPDQHAYAAAAESDPVISIAAGTNHYAAVTKSGDMYTWGNNDCGQLGHKDSENSTPQVVMNDVSKAVLCGDRSYAVKKDGSLWFWGYEKTDSKDGTVFYQSEPTCIIDSGVKELTAACITQSTYSYYLYAMIDDNDDLWMWGSNGYYQLGESSSSWRDSDDPNKVLENVSKVSISGDHCAAICKDGSLWMWGRNTSGQVGSGSSDAKCPDPAQIMEGTQFLDVSLNLTLFSYALAADGTMYAWGQNINEDKTPQAVSGLSSSTAQITTGKLNGLSLAFALDENGYLYKVAKAKATLAGTDYSTLLSYNAALKTDGSLRMWGDNTYGQLGNGTTDKENAIPIDEPACPDISNVTQLAEGTTSTAALTEDGSVWIWGSNDCGQLGRGTNNDCFTPVRIFAADGTYIPEPTELVSSNVKVTSKKTYTGKAVKPAVTVNVGATTLKDGTDYTVTYKNNKYPGKATVLVTGKGNYFGSVKKTFTISLKVPQVKKTKQKKKKSKIFHIYIKKKDTHVTGYQVKLSGKIYELLIKQVKLKKNNELVPAGNWNFSAKRKAPIKIYVRSYLKVGKTTYYSSWSKAYKHTNK